MERPTLGNGNLERLEETSGALDVELTSKDLRQIDAATSTITIQGDRYPEELRKQAGR